MNLNTKHSSFRYSDQQRKRCQDAPGIGRHYRFRGLLIICALASYLAVSPSPTVAQPNPTKGPLCDSILNPQCDPLINSAADQLNHHARPLMPQQVIRVGTFDGATNKFVWNLRRVDYPAYIYDYATDRMIPYLNENGTPMINADGSSVCPPSGTPQCEQRPTEYFADINSFNVIYEFEVRGRPSDVQLMLRVPDASGRMVDMVAVKPTVTSSRPPKNVVHVSFNPSSDKDQVLVVRSRGVEIQLAIKVTLRSKLGAFVVPYLLISILYEPPGAHSEASYSRSSTAGTVVSWGFSSGSGRWKTVNADLLRTTVMQGAAAALNYFGDSDAKALAKGIEVVNGLMGENNLETTMTNEEGRTSSSGSFFSTIDGFGTSTNDVNKYPGQGDRFIILRNVLYVYFVHSGTVYLAPVVYSKPAINIGTWELKNRLPSRVADKLKSLDPLALASPQSPQELQLNRFGPKVQARRFGLSPSRFKYYESRECPVGGYTNVSLKRYLFSSTENIETTSETTIEKLSGLQEFGVSIRGGRDNVVAYSYSSSTQQLTGDEEVALIKLECGTNEAPGFWVYLYFDTIFRTFLSVRGEPISSPLVDGSLSDDQGRLMARRPVTLEFNDQRYTVQSDDKGNFAFRIRALPNTSGVLRVGTSVTPITYAGAPLKGLRVKTQRSPQLSPPSLPPGLQRLPGKLPGGVRKRGTDTDPTSPEAGQEGKMPEAEPGKSP